MLFRRHFACMYVRVFLTGKTVGRNGLRIRYWQLNRRGIWYCQETCMLFMNLQLMLTITALTLCTRYCSNPWENWCLILFVKWHQVSHLLVLISRIKNCHSCQHFGKFWTAVEQNVTAVKTHCLYKMVKKPGYFYCAMLCIRGTSHGPVSVRLSVCHKSVFY